MRSFDTRPLFAAGLVFAAIFSPANAQTPSAPAKTAKPPEAVAGRTLQDWTSDLKSTNETVRLRAMLSLGAFGRAAIPVCVQALSDKDPAIRYWAASHLGDLAEAPPDAVARLKEGIRDTNVGVRLSSAYALCRLGQLDVGLPPLTEALKSDVLGDVLSAVDFLGRIGPPAKDAVGFLQAAGASRDYHVNGAVKGALRRILGDKAVDVPVPSPRSKSGGRP